MNYQEILEVLKSKFDNVDDFAYGDFENPIEGVGKAEEIVQKGGEGEGEEWYAVFFFPDHNVHIKIEGYYASYDGTSFDDWDEACKEVTPKEKLITVYE